MKRLRDPLAASLSAPTRKRPEVDRFTAHVRVDLAERVRNAVYYAPGATVRSITEAGLLAAVERVEREHNNGKPFPKRPEERLRGGRPAR